MPCSGNTHTHAHTHTHTHTHTGLTSRVAMARLHLISEALPSARATVVLKLPPSRTELCFADSLPSTVFRKLDPGHRGRE